MHMQLGMEGPTKMCLRKKCNEPFSHCGNPENFPVPHHIQLFYA